VGNLYNKDAILKYLIGAEDEEGISSKADCDEILQRRVKSLKDVVELKFEIDEDDKDETAAAVQDNSARKGEKWVCPVTRKQLGPGVKAVYIVPCGHVFAEEAVREMKSDKCLQVSTCSSGSVITGFTNFNQVHRAVHARQRRRHPPHQRRRQTATNGSRCETR
jgi:hypothetical protein